MDKELTNFVSKRHFYVSLSIVVLINFLLIAVNVYFTINNNGEVGSNTCDCFSKSEKQREEISEPSKNVRQVSWLLHKLQKNIKLFLIVAYSNSKATVKLL